MSITDLNQFHSEDMQDPALQDQFNTAAAVQELSDAELESVAGGFFALFGAIANIARAATPYVAARLAPSASQSASKVVTSGRISAAAGVTGVVTAMALGLPKPTIDMSKD